MSIRRAYIALRVKVAGHPPVTILLPGETPLIGLSAAAMQAIRYQSSHLAGLPIQSIKYEIERK